MTITENMEDWAPETLIDNAEGALQEALTRVHPFDPRESTDTILLASIAASTLAIAKKTKGTVKRKAT